MVLILTGVMVGLAAGVGAYTFYYAKGYSYLSNDPAACVNCHVMRDNYTAWQVRPHRFATCNDCHIPPGLVPKYATKAANGFLHSWAFTTGRFHEPIRIKSFNRAVTESACRHCHGAMVHDMETVDRSREDRIRCLHCHSAVGHK